MTNDLRERVARVMPSKFTKKPVTIEAIQWTGSNLRQVIAFIDGPPHTRNSYAGMMWERYEDLVARDGLRVFTLEGVMLADVGDYIIKGIKGEFYPCKPDIFEATYTDDAIAEMGGVKVEPLEWWRSDTGDLVCDVSVGRYQIQKSGARYCMMPAMGLKRKNRPAGDAVPTYHKTKQNAAAAAQADYERRILAAIEPAPGSVQEPNMDYCYNRNDWESTFGWDDRDMLVENMLPGEVMEVGTLQQGPTFWVVEHENNDGDRVARWFDNEADARALAEGQDND